MPAQRYEVRVQGRLSPRARDAFAGMEVAEVPTGTVIAGTTDEPAELHGILSLIQSLGLHIVSVERVAVSVPPGVSSGRSNDAPSPAAAPPG